MHRLLHFPAPAVLAVEVARRLIYWATAASPGARPRAVALSGGRIAGPFYDAIVAADAAGPGPRLAERPIHFCFADERCVPPDHPESNFAPAQDRLFGPLGIPAAHVHRLRGEGPPADAAAEAERDLRALLPAGPGDLPVIDLIWLGLGEDGHVASLFPGAPAPETESRAVYLPVIGPKPPPQRLTLTFAALAAAREIWVLASGTGKEAALAESLRPGGTTPLARVLRENPNVRIFTDILGPTG
jgi:6-phosphogluconolactonase